jgi:hypothetical protein
MIASLLYPSGNPLKMRGPDLPKALFSSGFRAAGPEVRSSSLSILEGEVRLNVTLSQPS